MAAVCRQPACTCASMVGEDIFSACDFTMYPRTEFDLYALAKTGLVVTVEILRGSKCSW